MRDANAASPTVSVRRVDEAGVRGFRQGGHGVCQQCAGWAVDRRQRGAGARSLRNALPRFSSGGAEAGGCGGSRFSPLRTIRRRASGWQIKAGSRTKFLPSTAISKSCGVGGMAGRLAVLPLHPLGMSSFLFGIPWYNPAPPRLAKVLEFNEMICINWIGIVHTFHLRHS